MMKTQVSTLPWWAQLINRAQSLGQPAVVHSVKHDAEGITVETSCSNGDVVRSEMTWAEVDEAVAFKRDCYTVDLICIAFGSKNGSVEMNEEMPEWGNIVRALPRYLPGCTPEETWFQQVAAPAFETNPVPIFRRRSF